MKSREKTGKMVTDALLAALLAILGAFKLPGVIPGCEFQLSAPFAICIAACFGFRRYIRIGVIASVVNVILGTHTILNVAIAMIFRIVAGGILTIGGVHPITLIISGPLGTTAGRVAMGFLTGTNPLSLMVAVLPGMVFTAISAIVMYPLMRSIVYKKAVSDFIDVASVKDGRENESL